MNAIDLKDIKKSIIDIVESFPTNSDNLLHKNSYFRHVYSLLVDSDGFLEIGYRKGILVEVCRSLGIRSEHVDISDDLLKATSSKENKCVTSSSIDYLKGCSKKFDLIFQDGSKEYGCRKKEYDLIIKNKILKKEGKIIVDDLHYPGCKNAFLYAVQKYKFNSKTFNVNNVKENKNYIMGLLY